MSKLTVIIPLLKKDNEIENCLERIAQQKIHNIDVLLVRDYEEKEDIDYDTLKKSYASQFPVRVIQCEEEHGISAARNAGIRQSEGEYITFMEVEDDWEDGSLKAMIDAVPNLPVPLVYVKTKPRNGYASGIHEEFEEEILLAEETDSDRLAKRPTMDQALAVFDQPTEKYMIELRYNIEDYSVLGCMFQKSFLKGNDILFQDDIKVYPDAPFICKVLVNTENTLAVSEGAYIRESGVFRYAVEKNYNWKQCLKDYMKCYNMAYSYCTSDLALMLLVQETMCSRYVNSIIRMIAKQSNQEFSSEVYNEFAEQMLRVDRRVINSFSSAERQHLQLLLAGDMKRSVSYMKSYVKRKKRSYYLHKKSNFLRWLAGKMFGNMDILQRCILFESAQGNRYYGDPKYIYKYLQENYPGEYKCVWAVKNKEIADKIGGKRTIVKENSLAYFYYLLRTKYWIRDTRQPIWWYKSPEQIYISTWLGQPLQKMFYDNPAFSTVNPAVIRGLKAQVEQWDALISPNAKATTHMESAFRISKDKILEIGHPRNDYLLQTNKEEEQKKLKEQLHLPMDKKTILYAPVWREDEKTDVEGLFKLQLGLHRMQEQLSEDYIILLRIHDYITDRVVLDKALEDFVYDFSFYDDVQELMMISDVMITDYSSLVFDYACTKRPIYFYWYDEELWNKKSSYIYSDFNQDILPGPVCHTTQEIINYMKQDAQTKEQWQQAYDAFYEIYCSTQENASERLARAMFEEMEDIFAYEDEKKEMNGQ